MSAFPFSELGVAFCKPENGWDSYGVILRIEMPADKYRPATEAWHFLDVGEWERLKAKIDGQAPWKDGT